MAVQAQTPRVRLQFDGNLTDSSGAGLVTAVTPSAGFTPTYATDRNGAANGAIVFTSGQSLALEASSLPGNSNQALGLRNAGGTNTSFTMCAWVMFTSLGGGQGYSTIFGNAGTGAGTLHAGLNVNSANTHFGFDGNDLNGGSAALVTNVWYHFAVTYDTTASNGQRIYINGIPDTTRTSVTNTLKVADLLIGNHGTTTDAANDFKGRLDDVVVYNTALKGDQVLALANGVSPASVPAVNSYFAPATTGGYRGTTGMWGIREIKAYPGMAYGSLVNVDRILKAYATTPGGTKVDYWAPVINFTDDEAPGNLGYFDSEGDFATNTPGADDNILIFARCSVKIPTAGNYTFGFRGDDGARLRVVGQRFTGSTRLGGGNADPANMSDTLVYPNSSGDSNTFGVVNLAAGEYDLEFSYWEGGGGSSIEVFAAPGSKTTFDGAFQLIGNVAAGGLEIVRDSDTVPTLTANAGPSVFVHSGSPASFTLAWSVAEPTTTLSIDQGIGAVAQSGSLVLAAPAVTTTYTITATTGLDVVTRSVTVYVNSPPVIPSFTASDTTVLPNGAVTLSWSTQGAASLTLNPGNINVTGTTSRVVNPASSTTYTLTATNAAGSTPANVSITTGAAPVISSFTASELSPMYGKETTLSWSVTGSDSQSLNQNIGSVPASGSAIVVPLLSTTYTLSAVNVYGTSTANVVTTIPTPVGVSSAGFTARRVSSTVAFPFSGQGYLQSALSLLGGQNAGTTTNGGPYTIINFADGADGDFTSGNVAFPGGGGDNFAVEITGTLVVNTPGEYTFMVNSDDGCRLRIDGVDVIVDDATHFPATSSGRIVLTKPTVSFQLVYYDVSGGASVEVSWVRPNQTWQQLSTAAPAAPVVRGGLVMSEIVANGSTLADEDGATQDWIEVWNSSNASIDLAGHFLTNVAGTPSLWAFPSKVLAPNEYLVVYASGKNRVNPAANLHTSFTLPGGGGYLALTKSNGAGGFITLTEFNPFPALTSGMSYGSSGAVPATGHMEVPTPAAPNAATYLGFVQPVAFSVPRGRYTTAQSLTLSTTTAGATIRYTTDGSEPGWARGTIYSGPISVTATTVVRANAFLAGWKPTEPVTHSYVFLDDVITQSTANTVSKGWPQYPVNGQVYRYGMNMTAVTNGGGDATALKNALSAAPTVMLNMSPDDFHGVSTGIYSNPGRRGRFWEREASLEIIEPNGTTTTQKDCGVRIRGNASRSTSNPKHAFHLYFRSLYAGDFIYPIFGNEGSVTRFDQIDMRCEQNNSWSSGNSGNNALMREEFARLTQRDMGQPYSRHGFFHLYINGIYWGIFNWQEKTEADYAANQFGGDDIDYDTVKSGGGSQGYNTETTDGNELSWRQLFDLCLALKNAADDATRNAIYFQMQGLNPDGTRNPAYPVHLNPNNLIDSQLATFFDGSFDAPMSTFLSNASNNWFAIRKRDGSLGGWMFFLHDHEHGMGTGNQGYNRVGPWGDPTATGNNWGQTWTTSQYRTRETWNKFNPHYLHEFLCFAPEYRQRFSDRAHKHLTGTGALTQAAAIARADALAAQIDPIIHAEAARWGSNTLTKTTWLNTGKAGVYNFINTSGPNVAGQTIWPSQARNLTVIEQLKGYTDNGAKPLFTLVADPVVSGVAGGLVTAPHNLSITNPNTGGTIYYTLDGSDPRLIGGGVSSSALTGASPLNLTLNASTTLKARIFDSGTGEWSGLIENVYLLAVPATASNTVISKIHYRPATGVTTGEFMEIMNIGTQDSVLTNCRFTLGITYTFPANYILPAGARCVIVENQTAFAAAFPAVTIAGQYSGGLSNSGERLLFIDNLGATIKDFTYGVSGAWPTAANGTGPCLVLLRPETNPAHGTGTNWRASTSNGGAPGTEEATRIASWLNANAILDLTGLGDKDNDGLQDLLEYALGTHPGVHSTSGLTTGIASVSSQDYMTLILTKPIGRDDVSYQAESSTSLTSWTNAILVSTTPDFSTGTETQVWRHVDPKTSATKQFLRMKITRIP
ncbi:MAG: chitobiase/beta-hexosaminidase C-terminal domain-containing protein [Verrucomicrobiaceae bacterium]|nr:chitobiase/beta-hexosaminidase C-terminal domain-containing protein [Verrucomicrobiaceae bacterium]